MDIMMGQDKSSPSGFDELTDEVLREYSDADAAQKQSEFEELISDSQFMAGIMEKAADQDECIEKPDESQRYSYL